MNRREFIAASTLALASVGTNCPFTAYLDTHKLDTTLYQVNPDGSFSVEWRKLFKQRTNLIGSVCTIYRGDDIIAKMPVRKFHGTELVLGLRY